MVVHARVTVIHNNADVLEAFQDPLSRRENANLAAINPWNITAGTARFHHGMGWDGGLKYNVIGSVGKGAFATVYKLATVAEGTVFAAKELE